MDPALEEKQNNESQQKKPAGESAINTINNLAGARRLLKSPLGKVGSRVVLQAGIRGLSAFLLSPAGLVLIAITTILIFTVIVILGSGGAPTSEINNQVVNPTPIETTIPSITPTETISPTPVAP